MDFRIGMSNPFLTIIQTDFNRNFVKAIKEKYDSIPDFIFVEQYNRFILLRQTLKLPHFL